MLPCQKEKDYCISNQLKGVGWAAERQLGRPPAFYKSATPQQAVESWAFKMDARRNFSEAVFRFGSQPLKFFRFDDVKLEYYTSAVPEKHQTSPIVRRRNKMHFLVRW